MGGGEGLKRPRVVTLDIETAPNLADVWKFWDENVSLAQLRKDGYIMSAAWRWLGESKVYYAENRRGVSDRALTGRLATVLDDADVLIGHFASAFDVPWILGQMAVHGMTPPSPLVVIDTKKEIAKVFKLPSYKLEYCARVFGCPQKEKHHAFPGHEMWVECGKGNPKAWREMQVYNKQDVVATEELYLRTRGYYKTHPNLAVHAESTATTCGRCGSQAIYWRGYQLTGAGKYRRFQCQECGGWGSLRYSELNKSCRKPLGKNIGVNG